MENSEYSEDSENSENSENSEASEDSALLFKAGFVVPDSFAKPHAQGVGD